MTAADPRRILEALQGQDDSTLGGFAKEQVAAARALAAAPETATCAKVDELPEPLALAVLEAVVREGAVIAADELTRAAQKPIAKAAKKALYQLKSRGHAVPERKAQPAQGPAAAPAEEPLPSLASAITGTGERALIIGRPVRGRVETLQLVIADEHGVVHLGLNELSRGQYKKVLKDAHRPGAPASVELPLDEARALLAEAVGTNLQTKTPYPEGLEAGLRHLEVIPQQSPTTLPPPEDSDQGLAVQGASLHALPEIAQWLPPVDDLRAFALKAQEIATSELYLDEKQRAEQLRKALSATAEAFLTPERGQLYGRRLWRMAEFLERSGRPEPAKLARAEARRLFHAAPGLLSPFVVGLFEKVLALSAPPPSPKPEQQAEPPSPSAEKRSPGGLILP